MPGEIRVTRGAAARLIATTAFGQRQQRSRSFGYVETRLLPDTTGDVGLPATTSTEPPGCGCPSTHACSGSAGLIDRVTALVLAASARRASAPKLDRTNDLRCAACALMANKRFRGPDADETRIHARTGIAASVPRDCACPEAVPLSGGQSIHVVACLVTEQQRGRRAARRARSRS
jgi:hypothetical protein